MMPKLAINLKEAAAGGSSTYSTLVKEEGTELWMWAAHLAMPMLMVLSVEREIDDLTEEERQLSNLETSF